MTPRNRQYEKTIIGRIWHESKLWIHLIIVAASAATAWQVLAGDVARGSEKNIEQDSRFEKIERVLSNQSEINTQQMAVTARIEQKVDYIREDVQQIKREVR